jgi:hypothetical protein
MGEDPTESPASPAGRFAHFWRCVSLHRNVGQTAGAGGRLVKSCPGLGEIRTPQLLPIVVTPYRFKNKRAFWAYCSLGIVMRSSSDWVRTQSGEWVKAPIQQTRGLNRNSIRTLKGIFKGATTTVIGQAEDEPVYRHYLRLNC